MSLDNVVLLEPPLPAAPIPIAFDRHTTENNNWPLARFHYTCHLTSTELAWLLYCYSQAVSFNHMRKYIIAVVWGVKHITNAAFLVRFECVRLSYLDPMTPQ